MKFRTKLLVIVVLFHLAHQNWLNAQIVNEVNLADLGQRIHADSSWYLRLAMRFRDGDTTLTLPQRTMIYYGYPLHPQYDPAQEERILDAANSLVRRGRYSEAASLLKNYTKKHPGCLAAQLEIAFTAWHTDDSLQTVRDYAKYFSLLAVPLKSGTGENFDKAFVLSSTRDAELLLDKLGFVLTGQSIIERQGRKYLIVQAQSDSDRKLKKTFYFDVSLPTYSRQRALSKKNRK